MVTVSADPFGMLLFIHWKVLTLAKLPVVVESTLTNDAGSTAAPAPAIVTFMRATSPAPIAQNWEETATLMVQPAVAVVGQVREVEVKAAVKVVVSGSKSFCVLIVVL
jgi:hypothetical protein